MAFSSFFARASATRMLVVHHTDDRVEFRIGHTIVDPTRPGDDFFQKSRCLQATQQMHQPLSHRSEEHTSELQSLMRNSYAVFCLKKKTNIRQNHKHKIY